MKAFPVYRVGNFNFLIKLTLEQILCTCLSFVIGKCYSYINPKPNIHSLWPDSKLGFPFIINPIFIPRGSLMIFLICLYTKGTGSVYKTVADGHCLNELS